MSTEPSTHITPNDLHAYLDDELLPDQAATVEEALAKAQAITNDAMEAAGYR